MADQHAEPARDQGDDTRRALTGLLPALRAYARFLARDRSAADDLVQDALLRALSALGQFQPGTNLKGWTFAILRNAFFEQNRRRRRERALLDERGADETVAAATQFDRARVGDLERLLWRLPGLSREALVLVGAQELSYEEAAAICAVPVGTMKARVSRARAQLNALLSTAPGPRDGAPA